MINHQKNPPRQLRVSSFGDFARPPPVWRTVGRLLRDDALDTSLEEQSESHKNQAIFTGKMWISPGKIGVLA